ncbi:MAG TPA: alpha/beta hydrolase [Ilumatobacteraceae bacterium]|nr:alpha/beta hydrolase [Ilumatobacteraceae bacterium]
MSDGADPRDDLIEYDEFGLFHENIAEFGLAVPELPPVHRTHVELPDGRSLSALVWGEGPPRLVFLHGGAQNAHTWDTVLLALGVPAVAIDLPGHGHSGWREDGGYNSDNMADDVAVAITALAPHAAAVVGMSMGGMTSIALASRHPELVRQLVVVDVTPGVNPQKAKAIHDFVNGPQSFASFTDLLARTMEHNPTRSESSLRRGILHNAHRNADGSWQWNYDRRRQSRVAEPGDAGSEADAERSLAEQTAVMAQLWGALERIQSPIMLVRGMLSPVVDDDDVAECRRRQPTIRVEPVDGAGHSVQGDRPVELAALIRDFVAGV